MKLAVTLFFALVTFAATLMAAWNWFVAAREKPTEKWDARRPKGTGRSRIEHWVRVHNMRAAQWAIAAALASAVTSVWTALSQYMR